MQAAGKSLPWWRTDPLRWLHPGAVVVAACAWVQHWAGPLSPHAPWLLALVAAMLLVLRARLAGRAARALALPRGARRVAASRLARASLLLAAVAAAASGWAVLRAQQALDARLPTALEAVPLNVVGVIDTMPASATRGWRARLRVQACEPALTGCPVGSRLSLHWPMPPGAAAAEAPFAPGERWRLVVRLKRPVAPRNPGLFDAELRALEENVAATGVVVTGAGGRTPQRLDATSASPGALIERARTALRAAMDRSLHEAGPTVRGVLVALVVGDQAAIEPAWWERFNRTGVGHLMSISGLHITMLAGLAVWTVRRLWRLLPGLPRRGGSWQPLAAWLTAPHASWVGGMLVAFGYAGLAGWGLPAQRTCWMLAAAGLALLSGRARSVRDILCTAAAVVCVLDPWAPMAAGFWLSFAAVAAIVWHGARVRPGAAQAAGEPRRAWVPRAKSMLAEAGRSQVAATVSLLPLGALFFSSVSLVGPLANAVAIPLVSGLVTPLALAGALLALLPLPLGGYVLALAALATEGLLALLRWCDAFSWAAVVLPAPSPAALALAVLACAVLLAPWPVPGRAWAAGGLLPLLLAPVAAPRPGELWITALDVGQGMAVLVETPQGRLLYDTGPAWSADSDAGQRLIGPYLRSRGIDRLQLMVVSHPDSDHAGGALSLLRQLHVERLASSLPADHPVVAAAARHEPCRLGGAWHWGDTAFAWLHPSDLEPPVKRGADNATSCVLRIVSPAGSVLLAGDIEAAQEARILRRSPAHDLRADVLLAPHHGSATSSSEPWLAAVAPRWVLFQVGYRNRFGHPAARVLQRYHDAGIEVLRTDRDGAVSMRLAAGKAPRIVRERLDDAPYWRLRVDPPPGGWQPGRAEAAGAAGRRP